MRATRLCWVERHSHPLSVGAASLRWNRGVLIEVPDDEDSAGCAGGPLRIGVLDDLSVAVGDAETERLC